MNDSYFEVFLFLSIYFSYLAFFCLFWTVTCYRLSVNILNCSYLRKGKTTTKRTEWRLQAHRGRPHQSVNQLGYFNREVPGYHISRRFLLGPCLSRGLSANILEAKWGRKGTPGMRMLFTHPFFSEVS